MHFKVPTLIILSFLSEREWNSVIWAEEDQRVLTVTSQLQLPEDQADALVQPGEGGVLGRDVLPSGGGVREPVRYLHLVRFIEDWLPVRNVPHLPSSAVPLTELPVLRLRVAAPVRVVEGNIEEEWRGNIAEELSDKQLDVGDIPS